MINQLKRVKTKLQREIKKWVRLREARALGLVYQAPNFLYAPRLDHRAVVIDAGCSYQADFSMHMIGRYGARAYAVDPTLKHRPALEALQRAYPGRFELLPLAISATPGALRFHESQSHESGSLMEDHHNVRADEIRSYEVEAVTLTGLVARIGVEVVDLLKLDIEGAEYPLLEALSPADLAPFRQIFIEFHHHAVARYTPDDTRAAVARICAAGFERFSLDDHNYVFWRPGVL